MRWRGAWEIQFKESDLVSNQSDFHFAILPNHFALSYSYLYVLEYSFVFNLY